MADALYGAESPKLISFKRSNAQTHTSRLCLCAAEKKNKNAAAHPELKWIDFTLLGQKPGPVQASPRFKLVTPLSLCGRQSPPYFDYIGLRRVSSGRAYLKPNPLTVPRHELSLKITLRK